MTYIDLFNAAMDDTTTRSRVKVAVAKYARYVVGQSPAPSAARVGWARAAIADIETAAVQMMWAVVGDPAYLSAGRDITDDALQSALESAVNTIYP